MPIAKVFGGFEENESDYLCATVTNKGSLPTTLTNFGLLEYETMFHRLRGRPCKSAIVANPQHTGGRNLPFVLLPGTQWMGSALYNDELREWASSGKLFVAFYHSHSKKPVRRKVIMPPDPPAHTH